MEKLSFQYSWGRETITFTDAPAGQEHHEDQNEFFFPAGNSI
jgi:hypothetical protein